MLRHRRARRAGLSDRCDPGLKVNTEIRHYIDEDLAISAGQEIRGGFLPSCTSDEHDGVHRLPLGLPGHNIEEDRDLLQRINVEEKRLEDYRSIIGDSKMEEILALAAPLKGAKVLHVNATAFGGGVSEILYALVPLMRDVGLDVEWQILHGEDEFFNVTKSFHNALQGAEIFLSEEAKEIFNRYGRLNAEALEGDYDFVLMHDPQTAAIRHYHGSEGGKHWIWRCHIDTSTPYPEVWNFLQPYLELYDAGIFTLKQLLHPLDVIRRQ